MKIAQHFSAGDGDEQQVVSPRQRTAEFIGMSNLFSRPLRGLGSLGDTRTQH